MQQVAQQDFVEQAVLRWRECLKSLGGSEIDERQAFTTQVLEKLLGYDHTTNDYHVEERGTRTDIAVYDSQHNKVLVIETKRSDKSIDDEETFDYALRYADTFTRYVALCNLRKFKLFKIDRTLLVGIDFNTILTRATTVDGLRKGILASEYGAIDRLRFIAKEEIYDDAIFDNFEEGYHSTDVAENTGFADLIKTLEKCASYLFGYALRAFLDYQNRLNYFDENLVVLQNDVKSAITTKDAELENKLASEIHELRRSNQIYLDFRNGLNIWKSTAQHPYRTVDEYREAFCREAAYVMLNKVLFIRVCEDKELLTKKISNGGVAAWKVFTEFLKENHKDLLAIAYSDASHLYQHIYERGIFDWYQSGNSELNDILRRIFWNLNHFDFANVDRDILGHLYERYLSPDQRKALGEFYTPPEIVRYILDAVGYVSNNDGIRGSKLIDFGCGSGGFLVESMNRLMLACDRAGIPKSEALKVGIQAVYGFDIDHFAIHICEMNLAFRIVDAYKEAKAQMANFLLPRLRIYQTNSLVLPLVSKQARLYSSEALYLYMKEREQVDKLKSAEYAFVVGNPPYVTKQLTEPEREYYKNTYKASIENRFNLYRLFIHRASMMLQEGGLLGYIVPNTWIADIYASAFRKFLRENFRIILVVQLPEKAKAFYKVTQSTTILVLKKDTKQKENYAFKLADRMIDDITNLATVVTFKDRLIEDAAFGEDDFHKFVLSPDDVAYSFIKKMRNGVEFLGTIVEDIQSGEIRQVEVKGDLHKTSIDGTFPVIHGDNTDAYFVDLSSVRKDAMWYKPPSQKLARDNHSHRERIVLQRIANIALKKRIKAAVIKGSKSAPIYVENGANYILLDKHRGETFSIEYILGVLNSSTLNQYFKLFSSSNNVQPSELKRLPIKKPSDQNVPIIVAIGNAVVKIEALKTELVKAREIIESPETLLTDLDTVPIFKSTISRFPSNLKGEFQTRRQGNRVYVSVADEYFECANETQAKCIEIMLSHIDDLSKVPKLSLPKSEKGLNAFVNGYEQSRHTQSSHPYLIEKLEVDVDQLTYKLYNLSSEEIDLVEHKTVGFNEAAEDPD